MEQRLTAVLAADVFVPEELQGWESWVLHEQEYRDCPFFFDRGGNERGDFVCAWPGLLEVDVSPDGGSFRQSWTIYAADAWLPSTNAVPSDCAPSAHSW